MSVVSDQEIRITFRPDGQVVRANRGTRLLRVVLDANRPVGYSCRGRGVCIACTLWVKGPASEITAAEAELLDQIQPSTREDGAVQRIACLVRLLGDVEIQADYW